MAESIWSTCTTPTETQSLSLTWRLYIVCRWLFLSRDEHFEWWLQLLYYGLATAEEEISLPSYYIDCLWYSKLPLIWLNNVDYTVLLWVINISFYLRMDCLFLILKVKFLYIKSIYSTTFKLQDGFVESYQWRNHDVCIFTSLTLTTQKWKKKLRKWYDVCEMYEGSRLWSW